MSLSNGIVFRNVRVFPGHGASLSAPQDVRVDGAAITSLTPVMDGPLDPYVTVIEGAGRVLPGKGQLRRVTTLVVPLHPETCCSATTFEWVAGGSNPEPTD